MKTVKLSETSRITFTVQEWQGEQVVSIMREYRTQRDPTWKPSKGMNVPLSVAKKFRLAMKAASEEPVQTKVTKASPKTTSKLKSKAKGARK